jgi:hypothetical protein
MLTKIQDPGTACVGQYRGQLEAVRGRKPSGAVEVDLPQEFRAVLLIEVGANAQVTSGRVEDWT